MSRRSVLLGLVIVAAVGVALWMVFGSRGPDITFTPAPPIATTVSPHDRSIVIRVVQADGRPATDAEVRVGQLLPRWPNPVTPPILEAALGESHRTDPRGLVTLPWQHRELGQVRVTAQAGDQWAEQWIPASTRDGCEFELRLEPSGSLTVQVLDAAGDAVVDAPLRIATPHDDGTENVTVLVWGKTDVSGTAIWHHVEGWAHGIAEVDGKRMFTVELFRPGLHVFAEVDAARLPTAPIVLRQPALGRLRVDLVDATGEALANGPILVCAADRPKAPYLEPVDFHVAYEPISFAVALGKRYSLKAIPHLRTPVEIDGPTSPDETVSVTLRADLQTIVTGRLLRNGMPAANCAIAGRLCGMGSRTDADGRFRLLVRPREVDELLSTVTIVDATPDAEGASAEWRGTLALDDKVHDLGSLALGPSQVPLLAAGHVRAKQLEATTITVTAPGDRDRTFPQGEPETTIHADGTFEVRGFTKARHLTLRAQATGLVTAQVEIEPGQHDLELVLRDGVQLDAAALVASRDFAACLQPELTRHDATKKIAIPRHADVEFSNGVLQCHWRGLEGGTYRLEVHAAGRKQPLHIVDNLVLPDRDGEARLVPMPITPPTMKVVRVTVPRPRKGDTNYEWQSQVNVLDGSERQPACADGAAFLFVTDHPVDVLVDIPGYREQRLDHVFADVTATPEPGIAVDIACAIVASLEGDPCPCVSSITGTRAGSRWNCAMVARNARYPSPGTTK